MSKQEQILDMDQKKANVEEDEENHDKNFIFANLSYPAFLFVCVNDKCVSISQLKDL